MYQYMKSLFKANTSLKYTDTNKTYKGDPKIMA